MLSTPRQLVQRHILDALSTIQKKNQYRTDVVTVKAAKSSPAQLREFNSTDFPALVLWETSDEPELSRNGGETIGGRLGNEFFWILTYELFACVADPGSLDLDDAGEYLISDVKKCLIKNRQGDNAALPEDIHFSVHTNNFEQIVNSRATARFTLQVKYNFREVDL